jgi:DNA-binding NarL/FixJ family response regulator
MGSIRIAVFEHMPLFRAGIVQVLNAEAGMEVVAEGDAFPHAVMRAAADVVIVDANLM